MQATAHGRHAGDQDDVSMFDQEMRSRKNYSRLIGALFLGGFLVYGVGFTLVNSVVGAPDFVATLAANQHILIIGATLMLLNTVTDIGKGVLFFPILENHGKRTALVYLAAITVQVVLLDIGVLFLLMLVPLAQVAADAGASGAAWAPSLGTFLTEANTMAYHIGQATLSFGGMFLALLLFRTRLIPAPLAALGVIGYVVHAGGSMAELFGVPISTYMLIPGGLFELALAFWLIIKGIRAVPTGGRAYHVDVRAAQRVAASTAAAT